MKAILFNDGPEPAPYMVSLELYEDPSVAAADNMNSDSNDNRNGEREHRSFEVEKVSQGVWQPPQNRRQMVHLTRRGSRYRRCIKMMVQPGRAGP